MDSCLYDIDSRIYIVKEVPKVKLMFWFLNFFQIAEIVKKGKFWVTSFSPFFFTKMTQNGLKDTENKNVEKRLIIHRF